MSINSQKVIKILRKTKKLLLSQWGKADVICQKDESCHNIVTEMDVKIENFSRIELAKIYPEISFVGEETGGNRQAQKFWLMDPIDGTQHFVRGLPFCTSMLALINNGEVEFGAIYDFIADKMYWAEKGKGAFCNDKRIYVSHRSLKDSYLCWETRLEKDENKNLYFKLESKAHLIKAICAGWEFAMVANGKLDGRITFDPYGSDYDYAPGSLLVSEAGGMVTNLNSDKYDYRNTSFIACNSTIYNELASENIF